MPTKQQVSAAIKATAAVAEAIRGLKEVPSGELYARLMPYMTLEAYEGIIGTLVRAGLVDRKPSHILVWIGPVA